MPILNEETALWASYVTVVTYIADHVPGLESREVDVEEPVIGGKYKMLQGTFDRLCDFAGASLSAQFKRDLHLTNAWRTKRLKDKISKFITEASKALLASKQRPIGVVAMNWVRETTG
jgi:hypothetical protein